LPPDTRHGEAPLQRVFSLRGLTPITAGRVGGESIENQQESTKSTLNTEQIEVIAAVVSGAAVTAATKAAGVDRTRFIYG
jgi:microcystin-dependent protein